MYAGRRGTMFAIFVIYVLFGLYFLNSKLNFMKIPESFAGGDLWIIFVGGVLLIIGGIRFVASRRYSY